MSSARVARGPCRTNSPAAARAIVIRVSALRRSVREGEGEGEGIGVSCDAGGAGEDGGVGVVLLTLGRLCPCGTICHLAGHPGVQVRGGPLSMPSARGDAPPAEPGEQKKSRARRPGGGRRARLGASRRRGGVCAGTWLSGPSCVGRSVVAWGSGRRRVGGRPSLRGRRPARPRGGREGCPVRTPRGGGS